MEAALNSRGSDGELFAKSKSENRKEFEHDVASMLRVMLECRRGEDLPPGTVETPARVTRMWLNELTSGYDVDVDGMFRLFPDEGYGGMVVVKDIPVTSVCEHHLVPIVGYAHIGYFPGVRGVVGLSKLPRVVEAFARRLQVQERLTQDILNAIDRNMAPRGVIVVISAEHLCMTVRGVQAPGTRTLTSAVTGMFERNGDGEKEEFFRMIGKQT